MFAVCPHCLKGGKNVQFDVTEDHTRKEKREDKDRKSHLNRPKLGFSGAHPYVAAFEEHKSNFQE